MNEQKKEFDTELLDYQEFTALVSALREVRILKNQARYRGDKSAMTVYNTRIKDICARVERDFDDRDHSKLSWYREGRMDERF